MIENLPYIVLSRQSALQRRMDVVSNNLANMNTTGFKRERVLFETFLMETENSKDPINMVLDNGMTRDFKNGAVQNTGNPLDIAISGDGFFTIEGKNGPLYTRNGNFHLNQNGEIVTQQGQKLLGAGGQGITIGTTVSNVQITKDGSITSNQGPLGKIELVDFKDKQQLKPQGKGLFQTTQDPEPVDKTVLMQGALETSNVTGIQEMATLIKVSRSYSSVSSIIRNDNDLRRRVMSTIGRMI